MILPIVNDCVNIFGYASMAGLTYQRLAEVACTVAKFSGSSSPVLNKLLFSQRTQTIIGFASLPLLLRDQARALDHIGTSLAKGDELRQQDLTVVAGGILMVGAMAAKRFFPQYQVVLFGLNLAFDAHGLWSSYEDGADKTALATQAAFVVLFNTDAHSIHNLSGRKMPYEIHSAIKDSPLLGKIAIEVEPLLGRRIRQGFAPQVAFDPKSGYATLTLNDLPSVKHFQEHVLADLKRGGDLCVQEPARRYLIWMIEQGVPDAVLAHTMFMATIEDFAARLPKGETKLETMNYVNMLETEALDRVRDSRNTVSWLKKFFEQFLSTLQKRLAVDPYSKLASQGARLTFRQSQLVEMMGHGHWVIDHFEDSHYVFTDAASGWKMPKPLEEDRLVTINIPSILLDDHALHVHGTMTGKRKAPFLYGYGPSGHFGESEFNLTQMLGFTPVTPFLRASIVDNENPDILHALIATRHDSQFHGNHHQNDIKLDIDVGVGIVVDQLERAIPNQCREAVSASGTLYRLNDRDDIHNAKELRDLWTFHLHPVITAVIGTIGQEPTLAESHWAQMDTALTQIQRELGLYFGETTIKRAFIDSSIQKLREKMGSSTSFFD